MIGFKFLAAASVGAMLAGCASLVAPNVSQEPAALRAGTYRLDPDHAALVFRVDHLGFSDYVGRIERFDASLDFDADEPEKARLEAVIDMTSLDVANDAFAAVLTGPDWFDAGAHPTARFVSTAIDIVGERSALVEGRLDWRGITAPATLEVRFNGGARDLLRGGYVVGFSAAGAIDRTAFGVDRFSGLVGREVRLEIEAEFVRTD